MADTPKKSNPKRAYITTAEGWTAGKWRPKGAPVSLTEREAQYQNVVPAPAKSAPAKEGRAKK